MKAWDYSGLKMSSAKIFMHIKYANKDRAEYAKAILRDDHRRNPGGEGSSPIVTGV